MTLVRSQWDRVIAIASAVAGAVVLIVGWIGVSNTGYSAEQLPYVISGGIGGIFLLGLGAVLWLSADLRDEWRLLDEIREEIVASNTADAAPATERGASMNGSAPAVTNGAAAKTPRAGRTRTVKSP